MADTPPTPTTPTPSTPPATPAAPAEAAGDSGTQSSINQAHAAALSRAEKIARTAQKGAYAAGLAAVGMAADFPADLLTAAATARAGDEDAIRQMRELHGGQMQQIQAWARAKFFFTNPARLQV
jgi:hypothetical protein